MKAELLWARRFCNSHGWPTIDVTRRSIEEDGGDCASAYGGLAQPAGEGAGTGLGRRPRGFRHTRDSEPSFKRMRDSRNALGLRGAC